MISVAKSVIYPNYVCIDRVGYVGGLILMWKDGIDVEVIGCDNNIIHVTIQLCPSKPKVLFSFMYGSTCSEPKKTQWNFITEFSKDVQQPWLILGDLNFHLDRNNTSSDTWVQNDVNNAGLVDIGYEGRNYTWTSNSYGTGVRKDRLDMALGNNDWFLNFHNAKLLHLNFVASDHSPVLLITDPIPKNLWRPFKFFRTWNEHNTFKNNLESSWNVDVHGSPAFKLIQRQHSARIALSQWNRMEFGDIQKNISKLQTSLEIFQNELVLIDIMLESKLSPNGNSLQERNDMSRLLTNHFSVVSCSSNPVLPDISFDIISKILTDTDNDKLFAMPSEIEIENFVKHMPSWSSPGPDGFQAGFYQTQWNVVGKDIIDVVQKIFQSGHMPRSLNRTYISLIPKYKSLETPAEFRPIGLCNASDKVISKILANRIKPLLKKLVSPYQAAFVPGRAIHDNIIIAPEMVHSMKHKEGISGTMAIKLDLSKAFNRLERSFINKVLESFGFKSDFCNLIMQCVSTTSINVLESFGLPVINLNLLEG
ncbi:uncharacterized protein LOC113279878 [Papaver somniferum]|uniref:uncharacterized protein LOC113279878 n=1 Tax=Papaver somniferum TaxID=3469 RepID=UPI000E6FA837|nr:uncharacterized protein LOC113279878 [Papaver somniferum]